MKIFGNLQNFKHFNPGDRKSPENVFIALQLKTAE